MADASKRSVRPVPLHQRMSRKPSSVTAAETMEITMATKASTGKPSWEDCRGATALIGRMGADCAGAAGAPPGAWGLGAPGAWGTGALAAGAAGAAGIPPTLGAPEEAGKLITLVLAFTSSGVDFRDPAGSGTLAGEGVGATGGLGAAAATGMGATGGLGWAMTGATGAAGAAGTGAMGGFGAAGAETMGATGGLGAAAAGIGAGAGAGGLGGTGAVGATMGAGAAAAGAAGGAMGTGGFGSATPAGAGIGGRGAGGAAGLGTGAVGASPKPLNWVGAFGDVGAGGMGGWTGSEPSGRVTESMPLAEFGGVLSILEVGGLMAEGAIIGAAGAGRGGIALPEVAPGFGGNEMRIVSFLIFPCVILREGLASGTVAGACMIPGRACKFGAGMAGAAGWGAAWAAAERPELMAIVCLGSDMPIGISGFCVIRLGGATGSLAPAGKLGLGGGGGGTAILGRSCLAQSDRQSF